MRQSTFPPVFKAVLVGFLLWLIAHRLLRDWMYSGEIWHPMLMDLSLFALCAESRARLAHRVVIMPLKTLKYFSTLLVLALALVAGVVDVEFLHAVPLDAGRESSR